jgi:type VI secretion system protein ImpH
MATEDRKLDAPLTELLRTQATSFGFYRAVALLHRLSPGAVPIGELGPPDREALRLAHDPQLIFHASDIASITFEKRSNGQAYARMVTTFLGLVGSVSPLATSVTEDLLAAEAADDHSLRDLYDLFHHRVLSLLYRAWKKHRFAVGFRSDASDPFTRRAMALVGLDLAGALPRGGLPASEMLALAPLVAQRTRPPRMLRMILERLLGGLSVRIEPFVARRVSIPDDQRIQLGHQSSVLGQSFTIGRTVVDRSGAFRVVIEPATQQVYEQLSKGGAYHEVLKQILNQFSGGALEPELELVMKSEDAPRFVLGGANGARLGVTSHLRTPHQGETRLRFTLGGGYDAGRVRVAGSAAEG